MNSRRRKNPVLPGSAAISVVLLAALLPCGARAQAPGTRASEYTETLRGPHHVVYQRVIEEPNMLGGVTLRTNSYTALATGISQWKGKGWQPANPRIRITPQGAIADETQHKVEFAGNLNVPGSVTITTPDGRVLRTSLLAIAYEDMTSGKKVIVATVKDAGGVLLPSRNEVLYSDAFDGIRADVLYVNMLHGFEQFVVFREQTVSPAKFGLSPESTVVQVISEFLDKPEAEIVSFARASDRGEVVNFGQMAIGRGVGFSLESGKARVSVKAKWRDLDSRRCLVEEAPFVAVAKALKDLPVRTAMKVGKPSSSTMIVEGGSGLPLPVQRGGTSRPLELASADVRRAGWAWDYSILNTTTTNLVLKGDETFSIEGVVQVVGALTVEPNTVCKLSIGANVGISASNVVWKAKDYAPAVFTSVDDQAHGEIIGSGSPAGRWYGGIALNLLEADGPVIQNAKFLYLSNALCAHNVTVKNAQFVNCLRGFAGNDWYGTSLPKLRNVLVSRVGTLVDSVDYVGDDICLEHVTAHFCTNLITDTTSFVRATNCLFVGVGSWQSLYLYTNSVVLLSSDAEVFQGVGAGDHYLAEASPYRNAGTLSIDADLLKTIKARTTYPPLVYSNAVFSNDIMLGLQAQRDTDTPDLGYHPAPLDYVFGGCDAYGNITVMPGTALGWFRTSSGWEHAGHGIHLGDLKQMRFEGTGEAPCYWVRCNTVQESVNGLWDGGYGPGGITGWAESLALAPEVHARFLKCSMLASDGNHMRDDWGYIVVRARDVEFYGGGVGGYATACYVTNGLWHRSFLGMAGGQTGIEYILRNCTFNGGFIQIWRYQSACLASFRDCVFDSTRFDPVSDAYSSNPSLSDYNYNAYITNASRILPWGANDIVTNTFNWQSGTLGDSYLPSNSLLVDSGSTTAPPRGLYHFTTQNSQDKELLSNVDRGYHYLSLDANGLPKDGDHDGIPDYLEDADGQGGVDSGETSWTTYGDPGLCVRISRPQANSTLP